MPHPPACGRQAALLQKVEGSFEDEILNIFSFINNFPNLQGQKSPALGDLGGCR